MSGKYANPYLETGVSAIFKGPRGIEKKVCGYWDGGETFVIRFTPTAPGEWTWTTESQDPGLNGKSGGLLCTAAPANAHGFMRRDPQHPYHFIWDDGTRFFLFGQTYYKLIEREEKDWWESIDGMKRRGMNKIRFNVPPETIGDTPDLDRWQRLDAIVRYMNQECVLADFIVFGFHGRKETPEQAARYLRYLIARYAAFPNVTWCICNEWNYHKLQREYWNKLGRIVRDEDPWIAEGTALRPLSIHQQTRINWQFFDQSWPTHVITQYGVRNKDRDQADEWTNAGKTKYRNGDEWGNAGILFNMGHDMPVVNDEYGYIGEPLDQSEKPVVTLTREKHRHIMWGIYLAGGYGSAGDKNKYEDGKPYIEPTAWRDPVEYQDVQHLVEFFTTRGIEYWNMKAANELVRNGKRVYVLAGAGQYVVYAAAGGTFTLNLPMGDYSIRRFDPRTGQDEEVRSTVSVGAKSAYGLAAPDAQDWVFLITSLAK